MGISDEDYKEIKQRLQAENVKFQFGVGNSADAESYIGRPGEAIYVEDKEAFAVCNGKSSQGRIYYPVSRGGEPKVEDNIEGYLAHLVETALDNTYPAFLTAAFAKEGSTLTRSRLIDAFEDTGKFCLPDGRSLPSSCYVRRKFGISYAPDLAGRFLRHYDRNGSVDSNRSIGSTQEDQFQDHIHDFREDDDALNFSGWLVDKYYTLSRSGDWTRGNLKFVYNMTLSEKIWSFDFPDKTGHVRERGGVRVGEETRPKNLAYVCFYRYDF
ncbi:hypothetical protein F0310_04425 (plasmid) [Borrelia sp. A-FGy1]|uniref:hypothetical protein n=1 Tax=Borrelia sp. A-FGy1 TaxID=2608247 RepID=UPI0015F66633|nr:hypothetical protein [Borrelia sp. A-FGy1]QMU99660.1 hypothetical protein F0310_04425 [Borrelia sp. A-FGy1]